jgi:hypothetical protein
MASLPRTGAAGLSRRAFLAVSSAAGLVLLVPGCTSAPEDVGETVTAAQVDSLADQVAVQRQVVAAYAAAAASDATLAGQIAELAVQADEQLARLTAASPDSGSASSSPAAPTVGPEPRAWLRAQVTGAADSHAAACLEQSGARAALLGSIAAGLRGHAARLA